MIRQLAALSMVATMSAASTLLCLRPVSSARVWIAALFPDGYAAGDADEALQLWNVGGADVDLTGWRVTAGSGAATFPIGARIGAGEWLWLARDDLAFERSFGHQPDWAWRPSGARAVVSGLRESPMPSPAVSRLVTTGGGPVLANQGGVVSLEDRHGQLVDRVVYGQPVTMDGWLGLPVVAYSMPTVGVANQILFRKLDPSSGLPAEDSDRATDWASDPSDPWLGRRVRFPGWDLELASRPAELHDLARLEVAVAPDHLFRFLAEHFAQARQSIDLLAYSFDQPELAEILAERAQSGVRVRLLLDGNPAGGIDPNQRWCVATIAAAGGEIWWHDNAGQVRRRYRAAHAKVALIDQRLALIGSENPSLGSAPSDDCADGTSGRRGVYLAIESPAVVGWLSGVIARDLDPAHHLDARPFQARDPETGAPWPDFEPVREGGGTGYQPQFMSPLATEGHARFRLISAPESALHPNGLLGLVSRAGQGDEILVEQMREPPRWGAASEGEAGANLRLAAYLDAARRGARVRVLLDRYFDDPTSPSSNHASAAYLNEVAAMEGLPLEARTGNPTGKGLHNKMVLLRLHRPNQVAEGERGMGAEIEFWSHIGSLNGTEVAQKANREVAIEIESPAVYDYLHQVFAWDWARSSPGDLFLPLVAR